jgi:TonB-dependent SusC/RagA subfamily outer membrane receptor
VRSCANRQHQRAGARRGEPTFAGATVSAGGKAAITNVDGKYTITGLPAGDVVVTIKFVGYQVLQQTLNVSGDTKFNASLKPSSTGLNEVVVIGYGTVQKKNLTGAVSTVTSKDFQKGSITTPEQLIAGKVPGISITSNGGSPGSGSVIRVRGGASLSASNDPLIVIDGVPLSNNSISGASNPLSLINPNDIETFTVLKDASATAIYGSRASNGVILITTKKGTTGAPKFNFSTQLSAYKVGKKLDVLTPAEFRDYVNANGSAAQKAMLGTENTDWQDKIYQTSMGTDNNLSVSGAYKNMPYRISGGYLRQVGVLITDKLQRTTGSITLNPKFFDNHLKVDLNLKGRINRKPLCKPGRYRLGRFLRPYAAGLRKKLLR